MDVFHGDQRRGLGVAVSPDGIHWTPADPWATQAITDGATYWMFDPRRDKYILYGRTKYIAPPVAEAWAGDEWIDKHFWGRAVARVASPDFLNWDFVDSGTAPVVMASDTEDAPGDEIYSMHVFPYESVYIGLVQVFHNQKDTCHLDLQLAVSHDGIHFTRVGDRTPFIPCGPVGAWDRFNNSVANNPPILVGDELRFYYGGRTYRHSPYDGPDRGDPRGFVGYASVKRDRFVSLHASFEGGVVETVPLLVEEAVIHLNAAARFGEIRVEAVDTTGATIARSEAIGTDALDIPVRWEEGGVDSDSGPIRLRIHLANAHLYALWCASE